MKHILYFLPVLCLLTACSRPASPVNVLDTAVSGRESSKGNNLVSWKENSRKAGRRHLCVTYVATIQTPAGEQQVTDSVQLARTGDGILIHEPDFPYIHH
jgi:hypothetical protein